MDISVSADPVKDSMTTPTPPEGGKLLPCPVAIRMREVLAGIRPLVCRAILANSPTMTEEDAIRTTWLGHIDAILEDTRADQWQPIETAPKDADVLLFCEITGEQFVAYWGTSIEEGDGAWIFAKRLGSNPIAFAVRNPTHWMPLPLSPEAAP